MGYFTDFYNNIVEPLTKRIHPVNQVILGSSIGITSAVILPFYIYVVLPIGVVLTCLVPRSAFYFIGSYLLLYGIMRDISVFIIIGTIWTMFLFFLDLFLYCTYDIQDSSNNVMPSLAPSLAPSLVLPSAPPLAIDYVTINFPVNNNCAICLEELDHTNKENKIVILPNCEHYFHKRCIKKWFRSNQICPVCRVVQN
jgi:hypothetical protein